MLPLNDSTVLNLPACFGVITHPLMCVLEVALCVHWLPFLLVGAQFVIIAHLHFNNCVYAKFCFLLYSLDLQPAVQTLRVRMGFSLRSLVGLRSRRVLCVSFRRPVLVVPPFWLLSLSLHL